jgi:hypothetical protein
MPSGNPADDRDAQESEILLHRDARIHTNLRTTSDSHASITFFRAKQMKIMFINSGLTG